MDGFSYVDIFATKGIEYLFVILFFLVLVPFWLVLHKPAKRAVELVGRGVAAIGEWFQLRSGAYFHQGHTWALPEGGSVVKVGMDDFAQKLVGIPQSIELPEVGSQLAQGEAGWKLKVDEKTITMLSPVGGEVVAVNEEILRSPEIVNRAPYDDGWLLKVKVPRLRANLKNLLSGKLAGAWLDETVGTLRQQVSPELGDVMQDGGVPVSGFVKQISPDNWEGVAAEFFMSD